MLKPYTVLLLRPDYVADQFGTDTYMAHVEAGSVAEAEDMARSNAVQGDWQEGCNYDHADYAVLLVLEGHHNDIKEDL